MMINPLSAISAQDSTKIDSTSSVTPLKSHGSLELFENKSLYSKVSKQSLPTINYTGINEIIEQAIPIYPLNTGAYGEFNSFSAFGAMPNQIKANYNGRTISNRFAQTYDLSEFSPEFLEKIELLIGSDAVISEAFSNIPSANSVIDLVSGNFPLPTSPQASNPSSGSMKK